MAVSEFALIERFFTQQSCINATSRLGIGDDCALLAIPERSELAVTTDTMVENIHFFADANPEWLGRKIVAVNLSDLASMGAEPIALTLAITLPKIDEKWLEAFAGGFLRMAKYYSVDLLGGDTTSGPLTLTVQAMGVVPEHKALRRSEAKPGDSIYLTGELGTAGLGLKIAHGYCCEDSSAALQRFHQPEPRVAAGIIIRSYANSCVDVSDGLAADLGHILCKSSVGASIIWEQLPLSTVVIDYIEHTGDWQMPLTAGDDYELCFSVPPENVTRFEEQLDKLNCSCNKIGQIEAEHGLRLYRDGKIKPLRMSGFEHFK